MRDEIVGIVKDVLGYPVESIRRINRATNNTVYSVEAGGQRYILKFYRSKDWPEDLKIPFVYRRLSENGIPCPRLAAFERNDERFPNGYLIESEVQGSSADIISLDPEQETDMYIRLAGLMSSVHRIPVKNFGYIGSGEAGYKDILSFFEDEFDDRTNRLVQTEVFTETEIEGMKDLFLGMLAHFNDLPSVLCHGDLSKKNLILQEGGEIVLIDWDDAMSFNWMADISRLTFWMRMNYDERRYHLFRDIFLEHYQTAYHKSEFDDFEKRFHIYVALDSLAYFIDIGDKVMEGNVKRYLKSILPSKEALI